MNAPFVDSSPETMGIQTFPLQGGGDGDAGLIKEIYYAHGRKPHSVWEMLNRSNLSGVEMDWVTACLMMVIRFMNEPFNDDIREEFWAAIGSGGYDEAMGMLLPAHAAAFMEPAASLGIEGRLANQITKTWSKDARAALKPGANVTVADRLKHAYRGFRGETANSDMYEDLDNEVL